MAWLATLGCSAPGAAVPHAAPKGPPQAQVDGSLPDADAHRDGGGAPNGADASAPHDASAPGRDAADPRDADVDGDGGSGEHTPRKPRPIERGDVTGHITGENPPFNIKPVELEPHGYLEDEYFLEARGLHVRHHLPE